MPEVTAAAVKALREKTGLPMMDCKRALTEAGGDPEAAIEALRKAGKKLMGGRGDRETSAGRIAVYSSFEPGVGAMIELLCESTPVANNEEFINLARSMVEQLALGPGAATPADLLAQPSPGKPGLTLQQQFDDLTNRIREVFRLQRICRIDGPCGGYAHHNGGSGVLLEVSGGNPELAKDICMHVAAMRPTVVARESLDPALVEKEREIAATAARNEGKPEKIVPKIAEGKLKDFYAQQCLAEQIHPNKEKYGGETVGKLAQTAGMKLVRFVHWELGKE
jgi:elongation factor Ts